MSSYEGDHGESLDIKPPQAAMISRREKREKKDRHRHKSERRKERRHGRDHREHAERRRDRRRRREREMERREAKYHDKHSEKHADRISKHERNSNDHPSRAKSNKDQHHGRSRGEYYIDERDQPDALLYKKREYVMAHYGPHDVQAYSKSQKHRKLDDNLILLSQLSPKEKAERDRRMERFLVAEKEKEQSQRDADVRRMRREVERRESKHSKHGESSHHSHKIRELSPYDRYPGHSKKSKHYHNYGPQDILMEDAHEISEDEANPEVYLEHTISHVKMMKSSDDDVEVVDEEEEEETDNHHEENESQEKDSAAEPSSEHSGSESGSSDSDSESDSGSSSSDSDDDDDEDEENEEEEVASKQIEGGTHSSGHSNSKSPESVVSHKRTNSDTTPNKTDSATEDEDGENAVDEPPDEPVKEEKEVLPTYYPAIMGCRSVDEFECLNRIEEGAYGVVYRAREKATKEIVALKRLKMEKEKEGFPITSLREVNTLLKAQHDNIVTVREIVVGSNIDKIFIVMDYVEHDLKSLMETMKQKKQTFTIGEIKTIMIQLLRAVHHLHDNWILHRDLKTSNLLLSHRGILKVGDFGLAREYGSPLKQYTPIVVTLWYRAPELLLGTKEYSCPVDVWSVGCIFGELLSMEPMFPGTSEIDQLNKIFKDLGTPSEKIWPGYSQLPVVKKTQFADYPYNHLKERFKARLSNQGFILLNRLLTYNPEKRIICFEASKHNYFYKEPPAPIDPAMFPTWPAKSENPGGIRKTGLSPKPPSGGKNFKDLGDDEEETIAARGFFLGGGSQSGPGFMLK